MTRLRLALSLFLSVSPTVRLFGQDVDRLAVRFAGMTAVTGLERAMTDSLTALLPGSTRDRVGNVTLTLGQGEPKRRSEEHTSELQSQSNLVCRLLLEKKKHTQ